jgi:hypothetical protein
MKYITRGLEEVFNSHEEVITAVAGKMILR